MTYCPEEMNDMCKIGIFGGTFDPPHAGHLAVACAALRQGEADEVWLMVSPQNPLKQGRRMSAEADRLAMARLAVDSLPDDLRSRIKVSDYETHLPRPSYTVATLRSLRKDYPGCRFRLIVGGDNLESFGRWREPEEILRDYGLIVYPRPGEEATSASNLPAGCVILRDVPLKGESSTSIRRAIACGEEPQGLPPGVADYIKQKGLYEEYSD